MKFTAALLAVLGVVAHLVSADFRDAYADSSIVLLTPDTFDAQVIAPDMTVLVQFYAPFSPNSKKFAPLWAELAALLEREGGEVRFAAIDADEHRELARKFKIDGYPSVVVFGRYLKDKPELVNDELNQDNLYAITKRYLAMTAEEAQALKTQASDTGAKAAESGQDEQKKKRKKKFAVGPKTTRKPIVDEEEKVVDGTPERPMEADPPTSAPDIPAREGKTKKKKKKVEESNKIPAHMEQNHYEGGHHGAPITEFPEWAYRGPDGHHDKTHEQRMQDMHDRHDRMVKEAQDRHDSILREHMERHKAVFDRVHARSQPQPEPPGGEPEVVAEDVTGSS